jgi:hypothetical protein
MREKATRKTASICLLGLTLFGVVALAEQPTEPRTLEGLIAAADDGPPAAVGAGKDPNEEGGPHAPHKKPAGTLVRPNDGVQHDDLDDAWIDYTTAVEKASEAVRVAITNQFDAATKRGDLEAAEKWQAVGERFNSGTALPDQAELKAAVNFVEIEFMQAEARLTKAYEALVKSLTKDKKVADARKTRDEIVAVKRAAKGNTAPHNQPQNQRGPANRKPPVFLSDLQEKDVVVGWGHFGKNGWLGYDELDGRIRVKGTLFKKALSMHGLSNGTAKVTFDVPAGYKRLETIAAISDTVDGRQRTPLTFRVVGDDVVLWSSKPLFGGGRGEECSVALNGAKQITLIVNCPGHNGWSQAVWLDPYLAAE